MATEIGSIADVFVSALESPTVQATFTAAIAAGEVPLETLADNAIANLKASGVAGIVISAAKGTVETEVNAEFAKLPPATIAAFLTSLAVAEAKKLGG